MSERHPVYLVHVPYAGGREDLEETRCVHCAFVRHDTECLAFGNIGVHNALLIRCGGETGGYFVTEPVEGAIQVGTLAKLEPPYE